MLDEFSHSLGRLQSSILPASGRSEVFLYPFPASEKCVSNLRKWCKYGDSTNFSRNRYHICESLAFLGHRAMISDVQLRNRNFPSRLILCFTNGRNYAPALVPGW